MLRLQTEIKYHKIGKGSVLRCQKGRIHRAYDYTMRQGKLVCGACRTP